MMRRMTILCVIAIAVALMADVATAQLPGGAGFGGGRIGGGGRARGDFGGRGATMGAFGSTAPTDQPAPLPMDEKEEKILKVLDEMDRNERGGMMNVPVVDGRLLRMLVESVNAQHVVEIGASNGYSGIWICLGLRNTGGRLTTHDIDPGRSELAKKNYARAGVDEMVTFVFGDAHEKVTEIKEPIDVLFIDADKEGYPDYLEKLLPLVRPGGLILAHNVNMADRGIDTYLDAVTTDADLETILLNVRGSSLSMSLKKRKPAAEDQPTTEDQPATDE